MATLGGTVPLRSRLGKGPSHDLPISHDLSNATDLYRAATVRSGFRYLTMTSEELARSIVARLRAAGHQAYLVGGWVRDLLLGRAAKDFDVATDARPDRVSELFERSGAGGRAFRRGAGA